MNSTHCPASSGYVSDHSNVSSTTTLVETAPTSVNHNINSDPEIGNRLDHWEVSSRNLTSTCGRIQGELDAAQNRIRQLESELSRSNQSMERLKQNQAKEQNAILSLQDQNVRLQHEYARAQQIANAHFHSLQQTSVAQAHSNSLQQVSAAQAHLQHVQQGILAELQFNDTLQITLDDLMRVHQISVAYRPDNHVATTSSGKAEARPNPISKNVNLEKCWLGHPSGTSKAQESKARDESGGKAEPSRGLSAREEQSQREVEALQRERETLRRENRTIRQAKDYVQKQNDSLGQKNHTLQQNCETLLTRKHCSGAEEPCPPTGPRQSAKGEREPATGERKAFIQNDPIDTQTHGTCTNTCISAIAASPPRCPRSCGPDACPAFWRKGG
jgi:predicted  nucleic acid-binding Zn-ribbon protein